MKMEILTEILTFLEPILTNKYFQIGVVLIVAFALWKDWKKSPWRFIEKAYKSNFRRSPKEFLQISLSYEDDSIWDRKSTVLVWTIDNSLYLRIPWPICYFQPCLLIPWEDISIKEDKRFIFKSYVLHLNKIPEIGLRFSRKFIRVLEQKPNQPFKNDRAKKRPAC